MLFPLESVSHLPDLNISALDHDYSIADAGAAAAAHGASFSEDASHQTGLELGLAISLAIIVNALIDACAHRSFRAAPDGSRSHAAHRSRRDAVSA
jgi:hypothetical protein